MILQKLTQALGVSGDEGQVRDIIIEELRPYVDTIKIDAIGNVMAYKKGLNSKNQILLTAHMDEVGLIISEITEEGYIKFKTIGGIDARVLPGKPVLVGKKQVKGVIGTKPAHLKKGTQSIKIEDLFIDIGVNAHDIVKLGDYISFDSEYLPFGNGLVKAKALDDRVGCAILIELAKETYADDMHFGFTVQEEVGCRGAKVICFNTSIDYAFVAEGTTCADAEDIELGAFSTQLGHGAAISVMDRGSYSNINMVKHIMHIAKQYDIDVQYKQTTLGGNDAGSLHISNSGVKTAVISVPCRNIHSPSNVASLSDIDACLKLFKRILQEGKYESS